MNIFNILGNDILLIILIACASSIFHNCTVFRFSFLAIKP